VLEVGCLTIYHLLDAAVSEKDQGIKMTFFNPSENKWKEVLDTEYRPYFFIPYPIPEDDLKVIHELKLRIRLVEKTDLFSRQAIKLTKVTLDDLSDPLQTAKKFSKSWEKEVSIVSSYMYDKNLVFGAQYRINRKKIIPLTGVSKEDWKDFRKSFSEIRRTDPEKYKLSKKLFLLCSQSVPAVNLERLGIRNKVDSEELHSMFMLARLANITIPSTYRARQVSVWIKSIFHNYLRKNNILIPTSKELRRGEEAHSVKGALTLTPEPGVHLNTVVVDFDSMYPSLIDSYNLSHETIDCADEECQSNKVPGLDHCVCTKRRGVYSILIGSLKDLRIYWFKPRSKDKALTAEKRILAESTSNLLKLILVSSYGVVIRIHGISRSSLGEAITAYGRYSLKSAYEIAKEKGLHPVYGDTDSLFLEDPSEEEIEWLIRTVKKRLKLDLSVDIRYALCVLPAASKAYFGIRKDGTYDIKGLTAIKSNSSDFIRKVFEDCVKELTTVKGKSELPKAERKIETIVQNAIEDLVRGEIPMEDLEYSVVIHDDPLVKLKGRSIHQPYQCAIQLLDAGKKVRRGYEMRFVKVNPFLYRGRRFTVKPTEYVKRFSEVNVMDYVRNLRTALNQTFKPMNITFSDQSKSEKTLFDFA
jgi:DNA polymerase elongation subunit (family B)